MVCVFAFKKAKAVKLQRHYQIAEIKGRYESGAVINESRARAFGILCNFALMEEIAWH